MTRRTQFHQRIKGSLMENEDWWNVIEGNDGEMVVEHSWSYVDPYGKKESNEGKKCYSVEQFLNGKHNVEATEKLRQLLADREKAK